jgi:hypothetical protein
MGIQLGERRLSLKKRLSVHVNAGVNAVVEQVADAKKRLSTRASVQSHASDVSELEETRGAALDETNALNDEGVKIVDNIAGELERRVAAEDRANAGDCFSKDGRVPPVTLFDYFARMARYVNVWRGHAGGAESAGVRSAVMALMYIEKLERMCPGFAVNRSNVHRIAMAAFLVATKFTEDAPISNDFWSKVAGVQCSEVNALEVAFCSMLKFELYIDEKQYVLKLDSFDMPEF